MRRSRPWRSLRQVLKIALGVAVGCALGYGLVLGLTPVARWNCERSAKLACGSGTTARATYAGSGVAGKCSVECEAQ